MVFTVLGVKGGNATPLDPALLTWSVSRGDDTDPGSVDAGDFHPYAGAGGTVTVSAQGCGASGEARVTLTLLFSPPLADGGVGPGDFSGGVVTGNATHAPVIVYPSAETLFPRNLYKVLFQWRKAGNTRFRLSFTGPASTVTVYTDGNDPACAGLTNAGCWQADSATWTAIAGSNAGASVTVEVDGTPTPGGTVYASAQENIGFSKRDVKGAIFYWAADVGGVQRATVSDSVPENYLVGGVSHLPNGDTVSCAACHTVSRDGTKMAVTGSATGPVSMSKGLWTLTVTPQPPPTPIQTTIQKAMGDGFAAFSPDATKLVWSARNGGPLYLVDATSGTLVSSVTNSANKAVNGTAPDWSPRTDVDELAFQDTGGNISRIRWDGGAYFDQSVVAAKLAGHNNQYPSYSPEGDYLAFTNNNTNLYLVEADGGRPVALARANTVVNNATWTPTENSMPTWAPPGDLHWIAFNSQRAYGLVTNGGTNQIWVAAVTPGLADGGDPSYPAFRLPFQNLTSKNHRAFWALDVRDALDAGPTPDAGFCTGTLDGCNPDGQSCCDPAATCQYDSSAATFACELPPVDAGPAVDAGCVATGQACDLDVGACCEQSTLGAYCGFPPDGGAPICTLP